MASNMTIKWITKPRHGSDIFGRCFNRGHCDGLTVFGVCSKCDGGTVCMCCNRVRQPDGSWLNIPHTNDHSSHGVCLECAIRHYGAIGRAIAALHEGQDCRSIDEAYDDTVKVYIVKPEVCHA